MFCPKLQPSDQKKKKTSKKELAHLDAEGVVWHSSAYEDTPESQNATQKTH